MEKWFRILSRYRRLFWVAASIMLFGAVTAYFAFASILATYPEVIDKLFEPLREVAQKMVEESEGPPTFTQVFTTIFFKNLMASIFMIGSGIFFGILPIYGMWMNGAIIGLLLASVADAGESPLHVFVTQILPHGIFELPAIFLAAALGLRLAGLVFQTIAVLWRKDEERLKQNYKQFFSDLPRMMGLIIVLLLIAATIESMLIVY